MADMKSMIDDIQKLHVQLDAEDDRQGIQDAPWSGEGCSEEEVLTLECRLKIQLPPSYRIFLLQVNGCSRLKISDGGLLPVEQIDWFRVKNKEWVDIYTEDLTDDVPEEIHHVYGPNQDEIYFHRGYLRDALQIGDVFDGSVYLLNPQVVDSDGEWESWCFSNSYPGAYRWKSFNDMVTDILDGLRKKVDIICQKLDTDQMICEAIPVLRREINENKLAPLSAIAKYIGLKMKTDPNFIVWTRQSNVLDDLLKAVENDFQRENQKGGTKPR